MVLLGDVIEKALESVGVTKARVSGWLGKPCNCEERQAKLNQLHIWAIRVIKNRSTSPISEIEGILEKLNE